MDGRVFGKSKASVKWAGRGVFALFLLLMPPALAEDVVWLRTKEALNGKSFTLENGQTVRLASLQAPNVANIGPNGPRPGEPLGEVARARLAQLLKDKEVRLVVAETDRHGRQVAQVYDRENHWMQEEMLRSGMAYVYAIFPGNAPYHEAMLKAESEARAAKRGLWNNPYFAILTPEQAAQQLDHYRLVEGEVKRVTRRKDAIYIDFGEDWKSDFSCNIARKDFKAFKSLKPESLEGKRVRVRGWIYTRNGPMMDLAWPGQVEVLSTE